MRRLPGARDDFADASHGLGIAGEHADDAEVLEDIFGGDGFRADAAFGESDVFRDLRIQMVADHEHIEMLSDCVHRVGASGIRGRRQDIRMSGDGDDVWRVAPACALGVIGVNRAAADGGHGGFPGSLLR